MEEMNRECRHGRDGKRRASERYRESADMEEMNRECRHGRDEKGVQARDI